MLGALSLSQLAALGAGAAIGGAVFGVAGFAYGVIASLFLHHQFSAPDVVFIVAAGALLLNLGLLPRFWRDIDLRRAAPYLLGATAGLPLGLWLLYTLDAALIRVFVGLLVIGYCGYALRQQSRAPLRFSPRRGHWVDTGIGFVGGAIGGVSGLAPLVPSIWYGLRGFSKQEQRALTQPFGLYVQSVMVAWLAGTESASPAALQGIVLATPVLLLAAWAGLRGFDLLDARRFQRIVIVLAMFGAVMLVGRQL